MKSFRASILRVAPPWLREGDGALLLETMATGIDGFARAAAEGLFARYPGLGTTTALPYIGRDRRIIRGFEETNDAYAARLRRWLTDWQTAGNAYALMRQIQGYLSPHAVRVRVVNNAGTWYTLEADGTTDYRRTKPAKNWDWDGNANAWSRFWVILYPPAGLWVVEGAWNDGASTYGEAGTIGTTASAEQITSIRTIIRQWKPAGSRCVATIVAFDDASFDPQGAPGAPLPDGTWGTWGKGGSGAYVAARLGTARYWET